MTKKISWTHKTIIGASIVAIFMITLPLGSVALDGNNMRKSNILEYNSPTVLTSGSTVHFSIRNGLGLVLEIGNVGNQTATNIFYRYVFIDRGIIIPRSFVREGVIESIAPGQTIPIKISVFGFGSYHLYVYGDDSDLLVTEQAGLVLGIFTTGGMD